MDSVLPMLDKALCGESLSAAEGYRLMRAGNDEVDAILDAACLLRDRHKGRTVTYSRKVFLPVTNLCRNRCSYCTFRKEPGDAESWTMSPDEIRSWLDLGREHGCREALICLGDKPELAYEGHRQTLARLGYATTADYVYDICRLALAYGLLPHTNAGVLTYEQMKRLREVNASMGLMLESSSSRLCASGMAHHLSPDKDPRLRLRMLRQAGELRIVFTTGILIGIGETLEERVDALLAIRDILRTYGHIQEVIVQNFRAKPGTAMSDCAEPAGPEVARTVAVARLLLGGDVNLQSPPNLNAGAHRLLLRAGINDWGGISPVTRDYVNPESSWPLVEELSETCAREGFTLRERLPVYAAFRRDGSLAPETMTRNWTNAHDQRS
jgi:FO synthase